MIYTCDLCEKDSVYEVIVEYEGAIVEVHLTCKEHLKDIQLTHGDED